MKPLSVIYWSRFGLGIIAGIICGVLGLVWNLGFLNGLSIGIVFYILTNYVLRRRYITKVEKGASKVFSMGIGTYFLMWVITWVLLYSILNPLG